MEEKDDWTCGREGDRHPFTQNNLQDEFITPIMIVLTYKQFLSFGLADHKFYFSA